LHFKEWDAGPISGTNIQRLVGATGFDFPFPLDTQNRPTFVNAFEGANAAGYHNAIHPLIATQQELPLIRNEEMMSTTLRIEEPQHHQMHIRGRRSCHCQGRSQVERGQRHYRNDRFQIVGALWSPRTNQAWQLLDPKEPFPDGLGSTGQLKESAARMECIPSTLVIHKRPDGADTCMASMLHPLVNNPGQKWLGANNSGVYYQPAASTKAYHRDI
jgi:hypothetical protein